MASIVMAIAIIVHLLIAITITGIVILPRIGIATIGRIIALLTTQTYGGVTIASTIPTTSLVATGILSTALTAITTKPIHTIDID